MRLILWLMPLLSQPILAQDDLGRLFYTPAERRMIDQRQAPGGAKSDGAPAGAAPAIKLRGVVRAANGNATVWLNDAEPSRQKSRAGGVDSASVVLPDGSAARMRVGDEWQDGAIRPPVVKIQRGKR